MPARLSHLHLIGEKAPVHRPFLGLDYDSRGQLPSVLCAFRSRGHLGGSINPSSQVHIYSGISEARVATHKTGPSLPTMTPVDAVRESDEALLASLGHKQELKRAFNPLEVSRARMCICTHIHPRRFRLGVWNCVQYHRAPVIDSVRPSMFYVCCRLNIFPVSRFRAFEFGVQWWSRVDGVGRTLHAFYRI